MSKKPFTLTGISAVQQELHALSSTSLKPELDLLQTNFVAWINSHFILQPNQNDFLNSVDKAMIAAIIPDMVTSLQNKMEIKITLPPADKPPLGSKYMEKSKCIEYRYDSSLGMQYAGQLAINFGYRV